MMVARPRQWVVAGGLALGLHVVALVWLTAQNPRAIGDTQAGRPGLKQVTLLPAAGLTARPAPVAPVEEPSARERPEPPAAEPVVAKTPRPPSPSPTAPTPSADHPAEPKVVKQASSEPPIKQPPRAAADASPPARSAPAPAAPAASTPTSATAVSDTASARAPATTGKAADPVPTGVTRTLATERYLAELAAWLERYKRYPKRAQRRRQEGTVELRFVVDRRGRVLRYDIARSSGHALLDDAVRRLIERAQPLPGVPADLGQGSLALRLPVGFYLR